jgi:hypothetical protein
LLLVGDHHWIIKYDTTASATGHTLTFLSYNCGKQLLDESYGYSASGEQLTFYNNAEAPDPGTLIAVDTYRRTCTRP